MPVPLPWGWPHRTAPLCAIVVFAAQGLLVHKAASAPSVHHFVGTVDAYLERLSEGREQPLKGQPPIAGEVILVADHGAGEEELLKRLAYVLHAEWKERQLGRSSGLLAELQHLDRQRRAAVIDAQLNSFREDATIAETAERVGTFVKSLDAADEIYRAADRTLSAPQPVIKSPSWFLLSRTLLALGAERLADLPLLTTVVYSDRPTSAQLPLPGDVAHLLREYSETWAAALPKLQDIEYQGYAQTLLQQFVTAATGVARRGVSKVQVFLFRTDSELLCSIAVYDRDGAFLDANGFRLRLEDPVSDVLPARLGSLESVRLNPLSDEFRLLLPNGRLMPGASAFAEGRRPSQDLMRAMFSPLEHDPLGFGVADALYATADVTGLNVVACLSDSALSAFLSAVREDRLSLSDFFSELSRDHEILVQEGWLLVRPSNPLRCESRRVSREALARMMATAEQEGCLGLRNFAVYYFRAAEAAWQNTITTAYQYFIYYTFQRMYPAVDEFPGGPVFHILSFLGSLTEPQFTAIMSGRAQFDVSTLSPRQIALLREIVGYRYLLLERAGQARQAPDLSLTGSEVAWQARMQGVVLFTERTTERAVVNAKPRVRSNDWALNRPRTLDDVRRIFPGILQQTDIRAAMDGLYVVGSQELVTMTIQLTPGVVRRVVIRGEFRPETEGLRFVDLPEDVRRAFGDADASKEGLSRAVDAVGNHTRAIALIRSANNTTRRN